MEQFFHENALYIVLGVAILLWAGFFGYIFVIDKKITVLENMTKNNFSDDSKEL
jgi:hypothetical protein